MAVVVKDKARDVLVDRDIAAAPDAVGTQRVFDDKVMRWQEDQVDPHITTMARLHQPASVGSPIPTYDDTGHEVEEATIPVVDDFIMTIETSSPSELFTITCQNIGVFSATIDWGDGGPTSDITTFNDADLAHVYVTPGTHTITISGTFPNIFFNNAGNKTEVRTVENLGDLGWLSLGSAFHGCNGMTSFVAGDTDTSNVTDMGLMFRDCTTLATCDVSSFDTSSVNFMHSMFRGCFALTSLDVTGFVTPSLILLSAMFRDCGAPDIDLRNLDITGVNNTANMNNLMAGAGMTTPNYDATLIAWAAQTVLSGLVPDFGSSQYTNSGAALAARTSLIADDSWNILDGGPA